MHDPSTPSPLLSATDRAIGWSGVAIALIWAVALVGVAWWRPDPYAGVWVLVLEMAFTGRAVNIAHGYADGYDPLYLFLQCGAQDVWLVLLAWPAIVAGEAWLERVPLLGRLVGGVHRTALAHKDRVARFGVPGLAAFVFFPFWSTGVLVGAAVGHLLGMRAALLLPVVIVAHLLSVASLVWLFAEMTAWSAFLESGLLRFLPWLVLGTLLGVHLAGKALARLRARSAA